jgi:hypothetical protein
MKTNKLLLLIVAIIVAQTSCSGQPKTIGESPLDLGKLDFEMNVKEFYMKSEKANFVDYIETQNFLKPYDGNLPLLVGISEQVHCWNDYTKRIQLEDGTWNYALITDTIGIEYWLQGFEYNMTLAVYGNSKFESLNMLTTLDNKLMAVCAGNHDPNNTKELENILSQQYGKAKFRRDTFNEIDTYTWESENFIFRTVTYEEHWQESFFLN